MRSVTWMTGVIILITAPLTSLAGVAHAHHAPRLFDNKQGDHGGSYERGRHIFFWMPDEKRFDFLRVCLWRAGAGDDKDCKRFKVRRVYAASYRPWGIEIVTARHFDVSSGAWNLRFYRGDAPLSPRLGFHRS